tara:strand:- start:193 stop:939 length:747 start_codon:yes stop_codon:yes gene_type:complete
MKKVVIIDDENKTRDFIKKLLLSFGHDLEIYTDGSNVETGIKAINKIKPDLVFLDIQMPDGNGFDVLKGVKEKDFEIIFITAYQEYAIQAIKFSALAYILKPIDIDELEEALDKALDTMKKKNGKDVQFNALQENADRNKKNKLVLKTQESVHVLELKDIVRCEADKNYTSFFLNSGKRILVSKTLKEYDLLLSRHSFFRVQQSHLINLNFIDRYDKIDGGAVIMKDGSSVPLSPAKKEQFFHILENL